MTSFIGSSSSSGSRNYLSQCSHSEEDYLSSGGGGGGGGGKGIRHPPAALLSENLKEKDTTYGPSVQGFTVENVVLAIRDYNSQIRRLFDMLKTADSASLMANSMSFLKNIMDAAQRYISSIPSHVKVTEVQRLLTDIETQFALLRSVNLDQISAYNVDEISQAARKLHIKL